MNATNGANETNGAEEKPHRLSVAVPRALRLAIGRYFTDRAWQKKRAGEAVEPGALRGYNYGMPEAVAWLMSLSKDDIEKIIAEGAPLLKAVEDLGRDYSGPLPWGQRSGSVFCTEAGPDEGRPGLSAGSTVVRDAHPTPEKQRRRSKGEERAVAKRGHAPARKA